MTPAMTETQRRQMAIAREHVNHLLTSHPLPMVLDALIDELALVPPHQLHLVESAGNKLTYAAHMASPERRAMLDGLRKIEGEL